jgi:predicted double-glycine peptidase
MIFTQLVNSFRATVVNAELNNITTFAKIFNHILEVVKHVDNRSIMLHSLKQGKIFVDIFGKSAIPKLLGLITKNKVQVYNTLRLIQHGTRTLQVNLVAII